MHLLEQDRAEQAVERQTFAAERQEWKTGAGWRMQQENPTPGKYRTRALATAEERLRVRDTELRSGSRRAGHRREPPW